MTLYALLLYWTLTPALLSTQVDGLQCYGCNVLHGQKYVDVGCGRPEVITCTHSHKGFKHRFCIKTESTALGIVLTSGCATSRHCQQQELPGVSIHCCDSDLCNSATLWRPHTHTHTAAAARHAPVDLLMIPLLMNSISERLHRINSTYTRSYTTTTVMFSSAVLGKVTSKSNALQYCVTPLKSNLLRYLVTFSEK